MREDAKSKKFHRSKAPLEQQKESAGDTPEWLRDEIQDGAAWIVEEWLRVDSYYKSVSKPWRRRAVLKALDETATFIHSMLPLLELDGRFRKKETRKYEGDLDVPLPTNLRQISQWLEFLSPDGKHPELPMLACAHELSLHYRSHTGRPNWSKVAEATLEAWPRKRHDNANAEWLISPGTWIRKRVKKSFGWWAEFRERRTFIEPLESFFSRSYENQAGRVPKNKLLRHEERLRAFNMWHNRYKSRLERKKRKPANSNEGSPTLSRFVDRQRNFSVSPLSHTQTRLAAIRFRSTRLLAIQALGTAAQSKRPIR
jgi:hypothetical protein